MTSGLFPRPAGTGADQLSLLGDPRAVRTPATLWRSWLADPGVQQRFEAKRYRHGPDPAAGEAAVIAQWAPLLNLEHATGAIRDVVAAARNAFNSSA